jgi:serine/threonine protein kinase
LKSAIRGTNIVHFFGACLEPKPCLVMEFCARGSLYDLLNDKKIEFKWADLLRLGLEMAEAIHILHNSEPQILHRDLKSMNFLVTQDWIIKVILNGY